ncbi:ABC transporter permease [Candidatus Woesearchaeota archaeon]|nr:ABC transporter permease [Candidatus Woesearchaeota archaeon]
MIKDYFLLAFSNSLKHRKLRSWLTILGIVIGIVAIVVLVSLAQGLNSAVKEEFQKVGANRILITAGGANFGPMSSSVSSQILTEDDLKVVRKVNGVKTAVGVLTKSAKIKFKDKTRYVTIYGTPTDSESKDYIDSVSFFDIEFGRQLRDGDKYKVIFGYSVANDFYEDIIKIGDKIEIERQEYRVAGIQKKAGTGVHDIIVRIPLDTAKELFNEPEEVSTIFVLSDSNLKPAEVALRIEKDLRDFRNVKEGDEDFSVQTAEQTIQGFNIILILVQAILIGIASISIIVGGVGIMNTMYTSVLERTREIGIMKAVGAKNKDILIIFLMESGIVGLTGGLIGVVIGIIFAKLAEYIAIANGISVFKAYLRFPLIFGVLFFSLVIGSIAGLLPAKQAAKLRPVEALKYDK